MESLIIKGTYLTPIINFNAQKGELELKGRSLPEHPLQFYKEIEEWMDSYFENPLSHTTVSFSIEYMNTSSSKVFVALMKKLDAFVQSGKNIVVRWVYEEDDSDMEETGEDYAEMVKMPLKLVSVEEFDFTFEQK